MAQFGIVFPRHEILIITLHVIGKTAQCVCALMSGTAVSYLFAPTASQWPFQTVNGKPSASDKPPVIGFVAR